MNKATQVIKYLKSLGSTQRSSDLTRFFKTKPGEYGYGDIFLGITMPQAHAITKDCDGLSDNEVIKLLASKYHEVRMVGALCLVARTKGADVKTRKKIASIYIANRARINNWDLVDLSAPKIMGEYLLMAPKDIKIIEQLSKEDSMWSRRIAILSTYAFIRAGQFSQTLKFAKQYLSDKEDLMHKATGWMLREVGKRDVNVLRRFLMTYRKQMPRTMLRYAIEKFSPSERKAFMK